jgi:hypothetical protein
MQSAESGMPQSFSRTVARLTGTLSVLGGFVVLGACATASSPDAWDAFRKQVAKACAVAADLDAPAVTVDPFGTETYGLASVTGLADDGTERTIICVVRKSPEGVLNPEISAGMGEWVAAPN